VAKERLKSPRVRLFVALELPEPVRKAIVDWQAAALTDPALRAIDAQALHVTLCFLGYLPERRIEAIAAILADIHGVPAGMRLEADPRPLPPRGRARLYVLSAPSADAVTLQERLSTALEAGRLYKPEKREFWPHVTVARARLERRYDAAGRRRRGRPMVAKRPPDPLPDEALEPFEAVRLTLYRSNLRSHGAEYVSLASNDLKSRDSE
jgi:RNA 2',3'-cyclic 3'-phosphodiesterase